MLSRIWAAMRARRAAMLEAEALVMSSASVAARSLARGRRTPPRAMTRPAHYRRVARIATRRDELSAGLDTGTKYDEVENEWRRRRGALCR